MSIFDSLCCGYAKVIAYIILNEKHGFIKQSTENRKEHNSRVLIEQFKKYNDFFNNQESFCVSYLQFINNFPSIIINIRSLNKRYEAKQHELLSILFKDSWNKLSQNNKNTHSQPA